VKGDAIDRDQSGVCWLSYDPVESKTGDLEMSHTPHELAEEFPDKAEAIHNLKTTDAHFAKLIEAYHDVNRAVHRAETGVEPTDDLHEGEMRKERMRLKDEIARALAAA
jgi:uncharacterized protein YdcH (DUF465 family)